MKSLFKELLFDKELVSQIREMKVDTEILYIQLMTGKITLKEYMAASR